MRAKSGRGWGGGSGGAHPTGNGAAGSGWRRGMAGARRGRPCLSAAALGPLARRGAGRGARRSPARPAAPLISAGLNANQLRGGRGLLGAAARPHRPVGVRGCGTRRSSGVRDGTGRPRTAPRSNGARWGAGRGGCRDGARWGAAVGAAVSGGHGALISRPHVMLRGGLMAPAPARHRGNPSPPHPPFRPALTRGAAGASSPARGCQRCPGAMGPEPGLLQRPMAWGAWGAGNPTQRIREGPGAGDGSGWGFGIGGHSRLSR